MLAASDARAGGGVDFEHADRGGQILCLLFQRFGGGSGFLDPGHAFEDEPVIEQQVQPVGAQFQRRFRFHRGIRQISAGHV